MKKRARGTILGIAALGLLGGGWFGYQQVFTKGLDHLPSKVCDNAAKRDTVIRVLPDTRSAKEGAKQENPGKNFSFYCHIYTSDDSILSGEVQVQDSSAKAWADYYRGYGGADEGEVERVSLKDVQALSKTHMSSVYTPCVPRGVKAAEASQSYALVTEVRVIGKSRTNGLALRQALTDFAYQITRRAYELGECQPTRTFAGELPHYGAN
ncbi:hypothetical protein [Streptomyces sp. NPDC088350]|uniref:hypothetical protein n=1 Tax=Streptomyces sp. NPDC088350 TaxID=3365854 RepID=UPI00382D0E80